MKTSVFVLTLPNTLQNIKCFVITLLAISLASVALILFVSPRNYEISVKTPYLPSQTPKVPYTEKTIKTPQNAEFAKITLSNASSVENYVLNAAKAENVSTTIVSWIVSKESQWGQNPIGDDGDSLGVWMWDIQKNPWVSRACALSLTCSTRLALNWLKAGKENKWTTWKFRCEWYRNQNPPDCPL